MNIPFILEKARSLYGQKEAVICGPTKLTYEQFADRVFALAGFLKLQGIGTGDRIAILHQNSHEFLETYYAAAQLGAVLNPLNFRLTPEDIAFILKDSGAQLLIASARFKESVRRVRTMDWSCKAVILTGEQPGDISFDGYHYEKILTESDPLPHAADYPDEQLAHLYYTSGTTGRPKGVMLSHKNVCLHALAAIAELKLTDRDNWIHVAPLFHLADAWATFAVTWVGGKHIIMPDFDSGLILSTLEKEKITITNLVPTMLNALINEPTVSSFDYSSLRALLSGGAPIAPELVKKIMQTFQCDYIQTYGMTETSPYLTLSILKDNLSNLSDEEQFKFKAKTGRPFMGVSLKVIREDGSEITPDGKEVGEIIVKGDIVTRGYWNLPEETAGSIREGWLYTGDLAVMDQEGYVDIVDRKKDMIITGGENVYSVEVENVLYAHPDILEAAVIGVPDPKWGEAVKAFVVLKPDRSSTEENIIRFCKDRLAGYKAPKSVDFLDGLPKTGSGKIFKKGLKMA
jgi:acyl-CoA synthetase (AMP-forming)/AMP-acid ligase II